MTEALRIDVLPRAALEAERYREIVALCSRAYQEPFADALAVFGEATHVVASVGRKVVSHALWVPRTLTYKSSPLRSAYVEAVATEPRHQGRSYATQVLRALAGAIASDASFEVGALSPSDPAFYARLGWESWRGPLAVATPDGVTPTPDDHVMILRLPNTPPLDLDEALIAPWRAGDSW